jgi:hypothetical protein
MQKLETELGVSKTETKLGASQTSEAAMMS